MMLRQHYILPNTHGITHQHNKRTQIHTYIHMTPSASFALKSNQQKCTVNSGDLGDENENEKEKIMAMLIL